MADQTPIERLKEAGLISDDISPETQSFINEKLTDAEVDALISLKEKLGDEVISQLTQGGCV
jgi:hypothetical protein